MPRRKSGLENKCSLHSLARPGNCSSVQPTWVSVRKIRTVGGSETGNHGKMRLDAILPPMPVKTFDRKRSRQQNSSRKKDKEETKRKEEKKERKKENNDIINESYEYINNLSTHT